MPWFLAGACLFEEGPPEEHHVSFPLLFGAIGALTGFWLGGGCGEGLGLMEILGGEGWFSYWVGV